MFTWQLKCGASIVEITLGLFAEKENRFPKGAQLTFGSPWSSREFIPRNLVVQGKPNFIGKTNGHSRGDEREVSIDAIIAQMKPERTSGLENSATSEHAIAAGNARDIPGGNIRDGQQQATKEHTRHVGHARGVPA